VADATTQFKALQMSAKAATVPCIELFETTEILFGQLQALSTQIASFSRTANLPEDERIYGETTTKRVLKLVVDFKAAVKDISQLRDRLEDETNEARRMAEELEREEAKRAAEEQRQREAEEKAEKERQAELKRAEEQRRREQEEEKARKELNERERVRQMYEEKEREKENKRLAELKRMQEKQFERTRMREHADKYTLKQHYEYFVKKNPKSRVKQSTTLLLQIVSQILDASEDEMRRVLRASHDKVRHDLVEPEGALYCLLKIGFVDVMSRGPPLKGPKVYTEQSSAKPWDLPTQLQYSESTRKEKTKAAEKATRELWYYLPEPNPSLDPDGFCAWFEKLQGQKSFFEAKLAAFKRVN